MPTRSRGMLERMPLAALGVLAVAGACWMWSTIPWPDAAGAGRAGLVHRWLGMVALFRLDRAAGLLPALIATDVLLAGALAVALALLPAPDAAVRALRRALLLGALSALYLFQVELLLPAEAVAARLGHGLAVGIGTLACVDLMVFMAGYPRRVGLHQLVVVARGQTTEFKVLGGLRRRFDAAARALDAHLPSFGMGTYGSRQYARNLAGTAAMLMRLVERPGFRWSCFVLALGFAWFASTAVGQSRALVFPRTLVFVLWLALVATSFGWLSLKYRHGDDDDRRRIGWIYLCPSVGMLVAAFWILLGPAAWLFAPGAFEGGGPHPFGLAVPQLWLVGLYCLAPMLVAAFLLGLACSVFYSGTLDPRLAMRRSLVAGTCGLSLTALFVFIENVVTAQISQRFGMPEGTGSVVAGTIAAVAFSPLRTRLERSVGGLIDRVLPEAQAPAPDHGVGTYSTTSSP